MSVVRVKHIPSLQQLELVWQRVREIAGNSDLIVLSTTEPAAMLRPLLGPDAWIIDAITCASGVPPPSEPNTLFIQSPTMLELIAMRAEQLVRRTSAPHVVLDDLNRVAMYNGEGAAQEFTHFLTNRLRVAGASLDILVREGPNDKSLIRAIRPFVDREEALLEAI